MKCRPSNLMFYLLLNKILFSGLGLYPTHKVVENLPLSIPLFDLFLVFLKYTWGVVQNGRGHTEWFNSVVLE